MDNNKRVEKNLREEERPVNVAELMREAQLRKPIDIMFMKDMQDGEIKVLAKKMTESARPVKLSLYQCNCDPKYISGILKRASRLKSLKDLHIDHIAMTESSRRSLVKVVKENRLTSLSFSDMNIEEDMPSLVAALANNTSLTSLSFIDCPLSVEAVQTLTDALLKRGGVKKLFFIHCDLSVTHCDALKELVKKNGVEELDVSNNPLTDTGGLTIGMGVLKSPTLQKLTLEKTGLTEKSIQHFAKVQILANTHNPKYTMNPKLIIPCYRGNALTLKENAKFILLRAVRETISGHFTLDLSGTEISNQGVLAIAKTFKNRLFYRVDLSCCYISEAGADALAHFLENNKVSAIDLSGNQLGDMGVKRIVQSLYRQSSVQEITLSENQLSDQSAVLLSKWISYSQYFGKERNGHLCLVGNNITSKGALSFLSILPLHKKLTIALTDNQLDQGCIDQMREVASAGRVLGLHIERQRKLTAEQVRAQQPVGKRLLNWFGSLKQRGQSMSPSQMRELTTNQLVEMGVVTERTGLLANQPTKRDDEENSEGVELKVLDDASYQCK